VLPLPVGVPASVAGAVAVVGECHARRHGAGLGDQTDRRNARGGHREAARLADNEGRGRPAGERRRLADDQRQVWVAFGATPSFAVRFSGKLPPPPDGVPEMVAVPSPLSTKLSPVGSVPVRVSAANG